MKKHKNSSERGVALFFVIIALLLLTAIAAGLMFMSDTESGINTNYKAEQQTYFASRAGLEEARVRIMTFAGVPPAGVADLYYNGTLGKTPHLPTTIPGAGGVVAQTDVVYITNPNATDIANGGVQPWTPGNAYVDDELCHEYFQSPPYPTYQPPNIRCAGAAYLPPAGGGYYMNTGSTDPNTTKASAMNYKWVRVTLKQNYSNAGTAVDGTSLLSHPVPAANAYTQICFDGTQEFLLNATFAPFTCDNSTPNGKPVYVITSLAVSPSGGRRMTQMEVADLPPIITNAALDTQDFVTVSGSSATVNGFDNCSCDCPVAKGSATPVCTNRVTKAACTGSTYAIYTQQTISTSGNPAMVAGTNPVNAQNQTVFPWNIPQLVQTFANSSGTVVPSGVSCTGTPANCGSVSGQNYGTLPNPMPPTGDEVGEVPQVTYFPGSIDLQAHCTGAGVLVVNGDLTVHGGIDFYGLIIVKGTLTFAGGGSGQANNVVGGLLTGNGSIADTVGGSINLQFDSCALRHNQIQAPPMVLSSHEVSY